MRIDRFSSSAGIAAAALALAGCAGPSTGSAPAGAPLGAAESLWSAAGPAPHPKPIRHVVIVMQENRSFDNLFYGYPGANTATRGKNSQGQTIPLTPVPLEATYGIDHNANTFFDACDGSPPGRNCKMDGFDKEVTYGGNIPANAQYAYVPHDETKLYFDMAKGYVLADNMFTSHIDASFVSHQYIIAGQAHRAVNLPTSLWGCGGDRQDKVTTLNDDRSYGPTEGVCFRYSTLADELDAKSLPWRFYAMNSHDSGYIWSSYQAIDGIYNGSDWTHNVINPSAQFLKDVPAGTLAAVTWIMPTFLNSDHATSQSKTGPDWVATIVNAVGESKFWDSTAIFVMWDEWGGWYDHVPPPYVDYDGLGMRVPLLIISPYAKRNYVSHVQYEHGSVLRFIEDQFGLGRLAASDGRANSPGPDAFDFTKPSRAYTPLTTKMKTSDFLLAPADARPPDEE